MGMSISDAIRIRGNRTTGFDYIRIGLAMSIILWHAIPLSYGQDVELRYWRGPFGLAYHFVLPMFFALSGFLVAGSLNRCPTLISFFALRVLRIVPALAVEITLSALLLGPALTSLPLSGYLGDPRFHAYFLNIIGEIHYVLPGLFDGNPMPSIVNAQLWTIPFELQCYLALGGLAVTAALRRRVILLVVVVLSQALWVWQAIRLGDNGGSGGASGPVLVVSFLSGLLFHLYQDRIVLSRPLFWAVLAGAVALSALPRGTYYLPIPATYLTVYLGLLNPRPTRLTASGDYSYGLYLYGYPLQQAVASAGPAAQHWWVSVGVALPLALLTGVLSWHFIEKPALAQRRRIPAIEARLLRLARLPWLAGGVRRDWAGTALRAAAGIGGVLGSLLMVNANVGLACACIVGSFAAAVLGFALRSPDAATARNQDATAAHSGAAKAAAK